VLCILQAGLHRPGELKNRQRILFSLGTALLLSLLGIAASFWAFNQLEQAGETRHSMRVVINNAVALLSELKDAETGQRGFLITGDDAFLQPYTAVRGVIHEHLQALRALSADRPGTAHLDAVAPLVDAKLTEMARIIDLQRSHDAAGVLAAISAGNGKRMMDAIRAELGAFMQVQESALAHHEAAFKAKMLRLFAVIVLASLLTIGLALGFAWLVYRERQQKLQNLVHRETERLLQIQEATNAALQQVNATLQVSEAKLAVTLNSIGDAVMTTDADARVTLLNPLAEALTGWLQADAAGRPVDEIFHIISKETRELSTIPVMATLAHGTIQGLANHTVLIARDGAEHDIADSCAPIRDSKGDVVGAVLVFRDVTADYAVHQAVRDGATVVQAIFNTVADGLITTDEHGEIETVNPAAERLFGYTVAELVGQNLQMLMPAVLDAAIGGQLARLADTGERRALGAGREVEGRQKDGTTFPIDLALNEMWLRGQRHFVGVVRDISARKRAEDALLQAGALQNAIFNSANFSSIATDAEGVIQIFNVGAEHMLGYAAADVVNQITPADISDPQEVVARAGALSVELGTPITPGFDALVFKASRGIEDIYELTYIRKDGSRFPAVVSVTALRDAQNAIIGYLLIRHGQYGAQGSGSRVAQGRRVAERDLQQRQLLQHCHGRQRRHPNLQRGRRAHAGLCGGGRDEPHYAGGHFRPAGSRCARRGAERRAGHADYAGL
jgi:PAS domain S-box-containing protein